MYKEQPSGVITATIKKHRQPSRKKGQYIHEGIGMENGSDWGVVNERLLVQQRAMEGTGAFLDKTLQLHG